MDDVAIIPSFGEPIYTKHGYFTKEESMKRHLAILIVAVCTTTTFATSTTTTSPAGGAVPGITEIGGVVLDLIGTNGARVVSQLEASALFEGFSSNNPLTIGVQSGFGATQVSALGGGISEAAVRITLQDGDTAPGNFDQNENTLLVNGVSFGDFSNVATVQTTSDGLTELSSTFGFGNNILSTGWFFSNDAAGLSSLFSSIVSTGEVVYELDDVDPGDNFFDFTLGIDGSLVNVGQGPTTSPPPTLPPPPPTSGAVPEPATIFIWLGLAALGCIAGRRRIARQ